LALNWSAPPVVTTRIIFDLASGVGIRRWKIAHSNKLPGAFSLIQIKRHIMGMRLHSGIGASQVTGDEGERRSLRYTEYTVLGIFQTQT
jgi:hypothetical protein